MHGCGQPLGFWHRGSGIIGYLGAQSGPKCLIKNSVNLLAKIWSRQRSSPSDVIKGNGKLANPIPNCHLRFPRLLLQYWIQHNRTWSRNQNQQSWNNGCGMRRSLVLISHSMNKDENPTGFMAPSMQSQSNAWDRTSLLYFYSVQKKGTWEFCFQIKCKGSCQRMGVQLLTCLDHVEWSLTLRWWWITVARL